MSPHELFFPALASCRRDIFSDVEHTGIAIDPSLCDYVRKNETLYRESQLISVDELDRLIDGVASSLAAERGYVHTRVLALSLVLGSLVVYVLVVNCVCWIGVCCTQRGRRRSKNREREGGARGRQQEEDGGAEEWLDLKPKVTEGRALRYSVPPRRTFFENHRCVTGCNGGREGVPYHEYVVVNGAYQGYNTPNGGTHIPNCGSEEDANVLTTSIDIVV